MFDNENIPDEILEARKQYNIVEVHAPHLTNEMQPDIELSYGCKCPIEKDGHCIECENFRGLYTEDGTIYAFGTYEGYCDTKMA
jgi:hypothetical protein